MDNAKFIEKIQYSRSQLHKNFIFKKEQIVILMITVQNDEVVISLQHENTVVPLQGTYIVYPEVDHVDDVDLKILNHKCLGDQLGRGDQTLQMTI